MGKTPGTDLGSLRETYNRALLEKKKELERELKGIERELAKFGGNPEQQSKTIFNRISVTVNPPNEKIFPAIIERLSIAKEAVSTRELWQMLHGMGLVIQGNPPEAVLYKRMADDREQRFGYLPRQGWILKTNLAPST